MTRVENGIGLIIHDQFGILNKIKLFYEKLEVVVLENVNYSLEMHQ